MNRRSYKWANVIRAITHRRKIMLPVLGVWILHTIIYLNFLQAVSFNYRMAVYSNEEYILNTPGCQIPNYNRSKSSLIKSFKVKSKDAGVHCGKRAIFTKKMSEKEIVFIIDRKIMDYYSKGLTYKCCYKFSSHIKLNLTGDIDMSFSQCTPFKNGTKVNIKQEVLTVNCTNQRRRVIYDDAYMIVRRLNETRQKYNLNRSMWNVLMIGLDTMSRTRFYATMPKTSKLFNEHGWYDYRAYHKIGHSTFPNMMTLLTGFSPDDFPTPGPLLLWDKYKRAGYFTAYGEDDLVLPEDFKYMDSNKPTTDHYMRPSFLTGDKRHLFCVKKCATGEHLLNYAFDFTQAYKKDNFFGLFWMNSKRHGLFSNRTKIDDYITDFFNKLHFTGILKNTVVIFFGDHGSRLEKSRFQVDSYYDERLPVFFMWLPKPFQNKYRLEKINAFVNQWRLITPYDVYSGLMTILRLSEESGIWTSPRGCSGCRSIFLEHSDRKTCADAGLDEMWCSCHNMTPVADLEKNETASIIQFMVNNLTNYVTRIKTTNCTICRNLTLQTVLRVHWYEVGSKRYHVVAVRMFPSDVSYEGVLTSDDGELRIVDKIYPITKSDPARGKCAYDVDKRSDCVCVNLPNCNAKTNKRTLLPFKKTSTKAKMELYHLK